MTQATLMVERSSSLEDCEKSVPSDAVHDFGFVRGTRAYRRASMALFLSGFATFSLLYCVQPLLPEFVQEFGVSPGMSALALSLTTGALALAIFVSSAISPMLPKKGLMFASMFLASACNLAVAMASNWHFLLTARLVEGIVLGGVPAVAMAYLAEEIHDADLGKAMGLYVAGTAFGGMMGRVGMGLLVELGSWRNAMAILGMLGLAAAVGFMTLLPASTRPASQRVVGLHTHARIWISHLRNPGLCRLFAIGFALTSVFVTLFNYAAFRLSAPPFSLGQTAISLIFLSYISGIFVAPWAGYLSDRWGRRSLLAISMIVMAIGTLLTLSPALAFIISGILFVTIGFFATHAIASGWIGALSGQAKGHASSLYLLFYYVGSSVTGAVGGWFWQNLGWAGVVGLCVTLAIAGVALACTIRDRPGPVGSCAAEPS